MITVVAALIKKDDKFLIAKRATGDEFVFGKWEFPGGKVEVGESEEDAVEREILEEFEMHVESKRFLTHNVCKYPSKTVDLRLYECEYVSGEFKLHDHSEYKFVSVEELLGYDLAKADIPLAEYVVYNQRVANLEIGKVYTNNAIAHIFKCSRMGGMRRSHETNSLVLIAKHNNPLYDDQFTKNGIINYTGMGTEGDQDINFSQNKTLANSKENGINVHMFQSWNDNEYYYEGLVELIDDIYYDLEPDIKGKLRKVVKFPLKKIDPIKMVVYNYNDISKNEQRKVKEVRKQSVEDIKEKAKIASTQETTIKEVKTVHRDRNPYVSEHTKLRAKGKCDLCGCNAPFEHQGIPYLESHHVVTLADNGPDAIYNTVAICPNCHRRVHVLKDKNDIRKLEKVIMKYLLDDNDKDNIEQWKQLFGEDIDL